VFVEFVLLGVGLLADLLAAVAEDIGQTGQRLFLPASELGRWTPNICAICAAVLCALMASAATLAFRLGGSLLRILDIDSSPFSMPPSI
jgi:hypothetical protein